MRIKLPPPHLKGLCPIHGFYWVSMKQNHVAQHPLPSIATRKRHCNFQCRLSAVLDQNACDLKKGLAESPDREAAVNRLAYLGFKTLKQVVCQQLNQQIDLVGNKLARGNTVNREAVLGFLDQVLHARPLVVEAEHVDGFPIQVGHDHFIFPQQVVELKLIALVALCFANDGDQPRLVPGRRLVEETNAFDHDVFIDESFPDGAAGDFILQAFCPFDLAGVADSLGRQSRDFAS